MKSLLAIMSILVCTNFMHAQLQHLNLGANNSSLTEIGKLDDRLVLPNDGKMYYKLNANSTWVNDSWYCPSHANSKFFKFTSTNLVVNACSFDTSVVYISSDHGKSWVARQYCDPSVKQSVVDLWVDNQTMYLLSTKAIYVSANSGKDWSVFDSSITKDLAYDHIAELGGVVFVCRNGIYTGDSSFHGIQRTLDSGKTWTVINNATSAQAYIYHMSAHDSSIYIGSEEGLFRSTDRGDTWIVFTNGVSGSSLSMDVSADTLVNLSSVGVFLSTNYGNQWQAISDSVRSTLLDGNTFPQRVLLTNGSVYVTTAIGLYSTSNFGKSWQVATLPNAQPYVECLAKRGTAVYVSTFSCGMYESLNNGDTWTAFPSVVYDDQTPLPQIAHLCLTENSILASSNISMEVVYKANRTTKQWKIVLVNNNSSVFASLISFKDLILGSSNTGLFYSNDEGENWQRNGSVEAKDIDRLFPNSQGDTLFAVTNASETLYSIDGMEWKSYRPAYTDYISYLSSFYSDIIMTTWNRGIGLADPTFVSLGSTDGGTTWDTLRYQISSAYYDAKGLIAGLDQQRANTTISRGIGLSHDNGKTWITKNSGMLPFDSLKSYQLLVDNNQLFIYGSFAIYRANLNDLLLGVDADQTLDKLNTQAYPTPACNEVQVQVEYSSISDHRALPFAVYNLQGQEVSTPADLHLQQLSTSTAILHWDCSAVPLGVYVIRSQSGAVWRVVVSR